MQYRYRLKCRLPSGRSAIAAVGNGIEALERLKPFNDPDYWIEEDKRQGEWVNQKRVKPQGGQPDEI